MRQYEHLTFQTDNDIAHISLNRPQKYNALNPALMSELEELCHTIAKLSNIRAVILRGEGPNFCVGADINWMQSQADKPFNDNKTDAVTIGTFFHTLSTLPQPLIGVAHGQVYGAGIGLLACCDVVFAQPEATFSFPEVKLGLSPAMMTPFIIRKLGYSQTRALFVTGETFSAEKAQAIGLVHHIIPHDTKDPVTSYAQTLKDNAPMAVAQTKQLVDQFFPVEPQMIDFTAEILAHARTGEEAQARMASFLKKPD